MAPALRPTSPPASAPAPPVMVSDPRAAQLPRIVPWFSPANTPWIPKSPATGARTVASSNPKFRTVAVLPKMWNNPARAVLVFTVKSTFIRRIT